MEREHFRNLGSVIIMQTESYIGLGSNLGDRLANIAKAVGAIQNITVNITLSSLYETVPEGYEAQPPFINGVCRIWTRLDPFQLLESLKAIQNLYSPDIAFVNGPRVLDLDILLYGGSFIDVPGLIIPHPRMAEREFVLTPLAELAPGLEHPVFHRSVTDLLNNLPRRGSVRQLPRS